MIFALSHYRAGAREMPYTFTLFILTHRQHAHTKQRAQLPIHLPRLETSPSAHSRRTVYFASMANIFISFFSLSPLYIFLLFKRIAWLCYAGFVRFLSHWNNLINKTDYNDIIYCFLDEKENITHTQTQQKKFSVTYFWDILNNSEHFKKLVQKHKMGERDEKTATNQPVLLDSVKSEKRKRRTVKSFLVNNLYRLECNCDPKSVSGTRHHFQWNEKKFYIYTYILQFATNQWTADLFPVKSFDLQSFLSGRTVEALNNQ